MRPSRLLELLARAGVPRAPQLILQLPHLPLERTQVHSPRRTAGRRRLRARGPALCVLQASAGAAPRTTPASWFSGRCALRATGFCGRCAPHPAGWGCAPHSMCYKLVRALRPAPRPGRAGASPSWTSPRQGRCPWTPKGASTSYGSPLSCLGRGGARLLLLPFPVVSAQPDHLRRNAGCGRMPVAMPRAARCRLPLLCSNLSGHQWHWARGLCGRSGIAL